MNVLENLWGALPLVAFAGLVQWGRRRGKTWSEALLAAWPAWALSVWTAANALGAFDALRPGPLKVFWSVAAIGSSVFCVRWPRKVEVQIQGQNEKETRAGLFERIAWVGVAGLLGLALVTALLAPPVTVDVLNYHAPRQLMWLQQGSLAHFITVNDRALMMPPLAEVIGLQFLGLTGGDYWANLPQWWAYALLPVAMVSTLRILKLSGPLQALGAWLAVCLPMAYMEASGGKNDLQCALWLLLLFREVARAKEGLSRPEWRESLRVGLLIGLAILTKSTALAFAPLVALAGGYFWWRQGSRANAIRTGAVAALVAVVIAAPFYLRNEAWYGTPLGIHRAEDGGQQANTVISPGAVVSNLLRNGTLHFASPSEKWNRWLDASVRRAHNWLGIEPDDRRTTLWLIGYSVSYSPEEETTAGAPWHLAFILVSLMAVATARPPRVSWGWLAILVGGMGLAYCATVKWQPWGARLQQPVFIIGIVLAVGVIGCVPDKVRRLIVWSVLALGWVCWWPSRLVAPRPLWGESSLMAESRVNNAYRCRPTLQQRDARVAEVVHQSGARDVMLVTVHDIAYPLMRSLQQKNGKMRFYGAPAETEGRDPDAIVLIDTQRPCELYHTSPLGGQYRLVGDSVADGIYLPVERVRELGWMKRLPFFAGWISEQGIPMVIQSDKAGSFGFYREVKGAEGRLFFRSKEAKVCLAGQMVLLGQAVAFDVYMNGRRVGRVETTADQGLSDVQMWLPCAVGDNHMEFRRDGGAGGRLIFSRLTLNDI